MTFNSRLRNAVSLIVLLSPVWVFSSTAHASQPSVELNLDVLQAQTKPLASAAQPMAPQPAAPQTTPDASATPAAADTQSPQVAVTSTGEKLIWVKGPEGKPLTAEQERALRKRPAKQPAHAKPKPAKKVQPKKEVVKEAV